MAVPRLVNGERKITNPRPENAGKLLIFCEGYTEFNYLDYLKNYIDNNLHMKYSDIVIEPINAEGNAKRVFDFAEEFLAEEENARKYLYYEKHLVFDCDAPDNIQEVIALMKSSVNQYELDYTNLLFETWLVMHFQDLFPENDNGKRAIIRMIREHLGVSKYTRKTKAAKGTIGKILGSNGNEKIRAAIKNAKALAEYWEKTEKNIDTDVKIMNPSADIYKLIERLLDEIEYLCG